MRVCFSDSALSRKMRKRFRRMSPRKLFRSKTTNYQEEEACPLKKHPMVASSIAASEESLEEALPASKGCNDSTKFEFMTKKWIGVGSGLEHLHKLASLGNPLKNLGRGAAREVAKELVPAAKGFHVDAAGKLADLGDHATERLVVISRHWTFVAMALILFLASCVMSTVAIVKNAPIWAAMLPMVLFVVSATLGLWWVLTK